MGFVSWEYRVKHGKTPKLENHVIWGYPRLCPEFFTTAPGGPSPAVWNGCIQRRPNWKPCFLLDCSFHPWTWKKKRGEVLEMLDSPWIVLGPRSYLNITRCFLGGWSPMWRLAESCLIHCFQHSSSSIECCGPRTWSVRMEAMSTPDIGILPPVLGLGLHFLIVLWKRSENYFGGKS